MAKKTEPTRAPIDEAKALYVEGDYKSARKLALSVLADSASPEAARAEAQAIVQSTRLARPSIIAGIVMALVVVVLFIWVLLQPHAH